MRIGEAFRFSNPLLYSGNVLLSRAVSSQVPSALRGLTSVFGMGTGGSLSLLSPEISRYARHDFPSPASVCRLPLRPFVLALFTHLHNCTVSSLQYEFLLFASRSLPRFRSASPLRSRASAPRFFFPRLSPRPISIIKLHTLPHFHR